MSRVFVVQVPKRGGYFLDISDCERFGEVKEACFKNETIEENSEEVISALHDYFEDFTEYDYILQAGEHTLLMAAMAVVSEYCQNINILKWNRVINKDGFRSGGRYECININVS